MKVQRLALIGAFVAAFLVIKSEPAVASSVHVGVGYYGGHITIGPRYYRPYYGDYYGRYYRPYKYRGYRNYYRSYRPYRPYYYRPRAYKRYRYW